MFRERIQLESSGAGKWNWMDDHWQINDASIYQYEFYSKPLHFSGCSALRFFFARKLPDVHMGQAIFILTKLIIQIHIQFVLMHLSWLLILEVSFDEWFRHSINIIKIIIIIHFSICEEYASFKVQLARQFIHNFAGLHQWIGFFFLDPYI